MRSLTCVFTVIATSVIGTSALNASILTFESHTKRENAEVRLVPNDALQQLLELRMGPSIRSTLGRTDESTVELLSKFAGAPDALFGTASKDEVLNNILVIMEGMSDEISTLLPNEYREELITSSFPTTSTSDGFQDSLFETIPKIISSEGRHCVFAVNDIGLDKTRALGTERCLARDFELQALSHLFSNEAPSLISTGESWLDERRSMSISRISIKPLVQSGNSVSAMSSLKLLFADLRSLAISGKQITVVFLPKSKVSQHRKSGVRARDTQAGYLGKSTSITRPTDLDRKAMTQISVPPICYPSNSSCNEATNTCSGHGVCYKKSGSENERESGACYACQCFETVVKKDDGTEQKVRWGGASCQKRDISSPFFLIAGVTLTMVVAISTAIGMIYQVGNGELPGVISAGVGAGKAQK